MHAKLADGDRAIVYIIISLWQFYFRNALKIWKKVLNLMQTLQKEKNCYIITTFHFLGKWTAEELITEGLVEVQENPAMITDIGMKAAGRCFPTVSHVEIYNCPHLHYPCSWFYPGEKFSFFIFSKFFSSSKAKMMVYWMLSMEIADITITIYKQNGQQ